MKRRLQTTTQPRPRLLLGALLGLSLVVPMAVAVAQLVQDAPDLSDSPYLRIDPEKIVLDERDTRIPCGECHNQEYEVWRETKHATGFDDLHRTEQAQAILDRMDFRTAKRESLCLKCHYTAKVEGDRVEAIAGVSCESCHGAARDWVNLHQDYGGATHQTEPAEHREMRVNQSIANGMLRPSSNLYAVAANCFECHTVPEEELINVGGHPSGSDFDLIEWTGEIRHNFLPAQWGGSEENRALTPERRRLMFVIGKALDYEYSIRGAARATKQDIFSKAMERRVKTARRELDKILRVADIGEIAEVLRIGQDLRIVPGNEDALVTAADAISEQGQAFTREHDGTELAALDPLIAGEPLPEPDEPDDDTVDGEPPPADADVVTADGEAPEAGEAASSAGAPSGAPAASGPSAPEVRVAGEKRTRPAWFPRLNQATVAPGGCGCHGDQLRWHGDDAHNFSADPLLNEDPRSLQIAQLYGLSASQMKQGNQICMNCHGTVVTGDEAFEVFDGVSCQSCHGPAEAYEDQHQNDGYDQGAPHGMVRLEDAAARANNCARCHHITDERLIASGHSTGSSFELASRNERIQHWEGPALSASALNGAYASAIGGRPVPNVQVASLPTPAASSGGSTSAPSPSSATSRGGRSGGSRAASGGSRATRPAPPRPRPVDRFAPSPAGGAGLDLAPAPSISDTTSTEDILLIVKRRLERLYKALGRGE